jgi:hypothetical protein
VILALICGQPTCSEHGTATAILLIGATVAVITATLWWHWKTRR